MTMSVPTREDIEAARAFVGSSAMHENVVGLPGVEKCKHTLRGSGDEVNPSDRLDAHWIIVPYKHHVYTWTHFVPGTNRPMCKCGNSEGSRVHRMCWRPEAAQ